MSKSVFSAILQAKDGTKKAFIAVGSNADKAGRKVNKVFGKKGKSTKAMKNFTSAVKVASAVMAAMAAGTTILLAKMGQSAVSVASNFEDLSTRLLVLTRDVEGTHAAMEGLVQFSNETPFELPDVADASIKLRAMGGAALSTKDNLKIVGDAAVVSGEGFRRMSFWFGRAFSEIQNRQALGEVQRRLIEIGLGSNQVSIQLEKMRKAGEDTGEMWELFTSQFDKARGAMELMQKTLSGRASTLRQFISNVFREIADQGLFDAAKEVLDTFIAVTTVMKDSSAVKSFGNLLREAFLDVSMITLRTVEVLARFFQENDIAAAFKWAKSAATGDKAGKISGAAKDLFKFSPIGLIVKQHMGLFNAYEKIQIKAAKANFLAGKASEKDLELLARRTDVLAKVQKDAILAVQEGDTNLLAELKVQLAALAVLKAGLDSSAISSLPGGALNEATVDTQERKGLSFGLPFDENSAQFQAFKLYFAMLEKFPNIMDAVTISGNHMNEMWLRTAVSASKGANDAQKEMDWLAGLAEAYDKDTKAIDAKKKAQQLQGMAAMQLAIQEMQANDASARSIAAIQMLMAVANAAMAAGDRDWVSAAAYAFAAQRYGVIAGTSASGSSSTGEAFDPVGSEDDKTHTTIVINNNFDREGFETSIEDSTSSAVVDDLRTGGPIRVALGGI